MSEIVDVEIPTVGESITEVQLGTWLKSEGDWVDSGEDLVEVETEKASVQLPSPAAGFLENISKESEDFAEVGEVIAKIRVAPRPEGAGDSKSGGSDESGSPETSGGEASFVMPAAQRLLDENGLSAGDVPATGPGGRLLKEDVQNYLDNKPAKPAPAASKAPPPSQPSTAVAAPAKPVSQSSLMTGAPES